MSKTRPFGRYPASTEDIRAVLGALNESDLLEIVHSSRPSRDLEAPATWLSGDRHLRCWRTTKRRCG